MRIVMILMVVFFTAMMMFGRNPIKEMQEKMLKYGSDPLERETNLYVEKQGGAPEANTDTTPPKPDENLDESGTEIFVEKPNSSITIEGDDASKSGEKKPRAVQLDNYYPPVSDNNGGSSSSSNVLPSESGTTLRSGQKISFDGTKAFAVDAAGNKTPLPDGEYTLYDGSKFSVSGGKKVQ